MITEEEALARVLAAVGRGPVERVSLAEAEGRWAVEPVMATVALPGFDNSAMDGYAVHADDCGQTDRWLAVVGERAAGEASVSPTADALVVSPGRVVRVFTGALLPSGAAAVVMQEDVEVDPASGAIRLAEPAVPGEFIRRRGADVCEGQKLVAPGDRLTPGRIGLLASQGLVKAAVAARPRLQVLSTGDEVVPPGLPLPHAAALYNSNGPMLAALARQAGAVVEVRHAADDLEALTGALAAALERSDIVVLAGGVSVGRHDYVRPALARLGWKPDVWRVAVKPGKPFLFAARGSRFVFGLPGNPVSAFVTFHLLVAPALRHWQGATAAGAAVPAVPSTLALPAANPGDRPHYVRGSLEEDGAFRPAGLQESHALFSLSRATALLRVPPATSWEAGRPVRVHPL
jgi:molybdopterin molybdotransferase